MTSLDRRDARARILEAKMETTGTATLAAVLHKRQQRQRQQQRIHAETRSPPGVAEWGRRSLGCQGREHCRTGKWYSNASFRTGRAKCALKYWTRPL